MKDITRRSFMKGSGGIAVLAIIPKLPFQRNTRDDKKEEAINNVWAKANYENNLRNDVSDLMKEYDIKIAYSEKNNMSEVYCINHKTLHRAIKENNIPIQHIQFMKEMLKEDVFKRGSYMRFIA